MQLGVMTNPLKDPLPQIDWIGKNSFDYVDLTVEPPRAEHTDLDHHDIRKTLNRNNLDVVVHTSPYLPIANPHQAVRDAARAELLNALDLACKLGSPLLTLHYLGRPKFFSVEKTVEIYARLLTALVRAADGKDIAIALENSPINRGEVGLFRKIFRQVPEARLLLDVAHTHIHTAANLAGDFLADPILGNRLSHVHVSDNDGLSDLHVPLGSVRNGINWPEMIRNLRTHPYDGRITLEVFSPDPDYLLVSRDKFLAGWNKAA
jgi:sugar phosphate isomerase/epimerase